MVASITDTYSPPMIGRSGDWLLAILGGKTLLKVIPIKWITRIAAIVMLGLAVYSVGSVIRG